MTEAKSTATQNGGAESTAEKYPSVTPEEHYRMIAEVAYFRAEKRGFADGDMVQDWLEASAEIDRQLQQLQATKNAAGVSAKQDFLERLEAAHRDWDARFDILKNKASEATAGLREELREEVDALAGKRTAIEVRMQELRRRTEDAWEDLREGMESAWKELQDTLHRVASRLK